MHDYPLFPALADASAGLLDGGHLWLVEDVTGTPLRFSLRESGLVRFGDADRTYDDPAALGPDARRAVGHVRERIDRDALRDAVADVSDVTFVGVATAYRGIDYDWDRLPPFLGLDVVTSRGARPPDAAEAAFDALGLDAANALARERRARDFHPDGYVFPDSAWRDGPVAGVLVRDKRGGRARLPNPDVSVGPDATPDWLTGETTPADAAARYATPERLDRAATDLADGARAATDEALTDRVLADAHREAGPALADAFDGDALRSAVAERVRDERR